MLPSTISPALDQHQEQRALSRYQEALLALARAQSVVDPLVLSELEQRGLIEQVKRQWRIVSRIMQHFVLAEGELLARARPQTVEAITARGPEPTQADFGLAGQGVERAKEKHFLRAFSYLEGQVYAYLQTRVGRVCSKHDIKQAVWQDKPLTDSGLQKIIERIREKLEPDPKHPQYLIAVKGVGYMLRRDPA